MEEICITAASNIPSDDDDEYHNLFVHFSNTPKSERTRAACKNSTMSLPVSGVISGSTQDIESVQAPVVAQLTHTVIVYIKC